MPPKPRKSRAKTPEDVRSLCRAHTTGAIRTLVGIMNQPDAPPAARRAAASDLLDRGWGKAVQPTDNNTKLTGKVQIELVKVD